MLSQVLQEGRNIKIELLPSSPRSEVDLAVKATVGRVYLKSFLVKIPVAERTQLNFTVGNQISLCIGSNGYLYSGSAKILEVDEDTRAWMQISSPERLHRIEMRGWVRVPAELQVHYRLANYNWPFYNANTLDISGGGLMFLARHIVDEQLELELNVDLPNNRTIDSVVEVKRCEGYNTRWGERFKIGCSFRNIRESERETLIRYVFDKQRDLMKKAR